jgi:hypothetical protein
MLRSGLVALFLCLLGAAAMAAEPYIGSWAAKPSDCGSEPLFIFSAHNVVGATFACKSARFTRSAKGWAVAAKACSSENGDPADMAFSIVIADGKLQVLWDESSKSDKLVKCQK